MSVSAQTAGILNSLFPMSFSMFVVALYTPPLALNFSN